MEKRPVAHTLISLTGAMLTLSACSAVFSKHAVGTITVPQPAQPVDAQRDALIARAKALGYDTAMLRITKQP